MAEQIYFYFKKGEVIKDLEIDFKVGDSTVKYLQCKGLEDIGKPKNKYTESYADSNELRCYEPPNGEITHEPTDVTFTLVFVGQNRQQVYSNFYNFISTDIITYWDTKRNRTVDLTLLETVKPSKDEYKGSTPYMQCDFKFKNIRGKWYNNNNG